MPDPDFSRAIAAERPAGDAPVNLTERPEDASTAVPVMIALTWPGSAEFTWGAVTAMTGWAYLTGLRILAVRRSDESWWYRLGTLACYAPAMLWGTFVLRPLRFWGIATCLRQGWTTRTGGAEIGIGEPALERVAA